MKHKYYLFFSIFILFFNLACNNPEPNKIRIGFSQGLGNHPFRESMNHTMEIQASLHKNVDLEIRKAENDMKRQIADINKMISEKKDVIIISPIDLQLLVPVIERAYQQKIPVILLDRKVNTEKYTTYIGADNTEIGKEAANYIISDSKGVKNIIEFQGDDNSSPGLERSTGFHQVIDSRPDVNFLKSYKGFPDEEFKKYLPTLAGKELYIFTFNDEIANSVWKMAREAGMEKNIKIIGVDGLNDKDGGIQMVIDGKLNATLLYPTGSSADRCGNPGNCLFFGQRKNLDKIC